MNRVGVKLGLAFFFTLLVAACSPQSSEPDSAAVLKTGIMNIKNPEKQVYTSGQPSKEQLKLVADSGVKHVINLRPVSEQDWDEAAAVNETGMTYHSIPVAGAAGVTLENAQQLKATLTEIGNEPVLIHCASSNRVGALAALIEAEQSGDPDQAITKGKAWGMSSLQGKVRSIIDN